MASLTLRQSKGSPLTFAEVDGNFTALNNELAEKALATRSIAAGTGLTGGGDLSANRTISLSAGSIASLAKADESAPLDSPALTGNPTAPTPAAQDNDTSIATTAFVQNAVVQSGPLAGFRNAIINGNFDVWQRSTNAFTNVSFPAADRWDFWRSEPPGSGAAGSMQRMAFSNGQTDVPGSPLYYLRLIESTAGSGYAGKNLRQSLEDPLRYANQQYTLSFWAKSNAANTVTPSWFLEPGVGGTQTSGTTFANLGTANLTTSWQKFTYTFTFPSFPGFVPGANANILIYWTVPTGVTFTLDIAQVQLEPGPVATPFERRPIGTELALCQRYFRKLEEPSNTYSPAVGVCRLTGGLAACSFSLGTPMRALPSYSGNVSIESNGASFNNLTPTMRDLSTDGTILYFTAPAAIADDHAALWHVGFTGGTLSAEL
jgi:hypothetical protein